MCIPLTAYQYTVGLLRYRLFNFLGVASFYTFVGGNGNFLKRAFLSSSRHRVIVKIRPLRGPLHLAPWAWRDIWARSLAGKISKELLPDFV